jgi:hypothetical protein
MIIFDYWVKSKYRYMPLNHPLIATIIHIISQQITTMTLEEIFLYIKTMDSEKLIYISTNKDLHKLIIIFQKV